MPNDHPIHHLLVDDALEDAAMGGAEGIERLFRRRQARRVTRSELAQARQRAGEIGYQGEMLIQAHLERLVDGGELAAFKWVSDQNAVAPYDFELTSVAGGIERIDVKATQGEFARILHISLAELHVMADATVPYRVYRVSDLHDGAGTLRVSMQLATYAQALLEALKHLPPGAVPDSFSIDPNTLSFGAAIVVQLGDN